MTVVDTSGIVDLLLRQEAGEEVARLFAREQVLHAPDVLVFEVLSALRRATLRERIAVDRAERAIKRLGRLPIELFPSLELRYGAWRHRHNLKIGDALFLELARVLREPLATKDGGLAAAARSHGVPVAKLSG